MSAEHFQTFLTADLRTARNGRGVEYAEANTQQPRSFLVDPQDGLVHNPDRPTRGWAACYLRVEHVLELAARAVEEQPMDGLTGDHAEKRQHVADVIRDLRFCVRELALDAAGDGMLTELAWTEALARVQKTLSTVKVSTP